MGDPYVTLLLQGYPEYPPDGAPSLSVTLPIGSLKANTVLVVANNIRGCPTPPQSSTVNRLQTIGVGIIHIAFPHGHK